MACPITPSVERLVELALEEDLGRGDATSRAIVLEPETTARAKILAKRPCVVCGLALAEFVFSRVDPAVLLEPLVPEGAHVDQGTEVAAVAGPARSILAAERTALNFLMRLSGIATLTRQYVDALRKAGATARLTDTRKTTPGWRLLEKYAVATGGAANHRMDLASGILIKENHVAVCGSVREAVERAKQWASHTIRIEVEVRDLEELADALEAGADVVLLDNMDSSELRKAIALAKGKALLEVSGGLDIESAVAAAELGADVVSVGRLTHSAPAADLSLLIEEVEVPIAPSQENEVPTDDDAP